MSRQWSRNAAAFSEIVAQRSQAKADTFRFIQIGAHNGFMDDPIRNWILRYRWTGVFVEPQKDQFAQLRQNYSQVADSQCLRFENSAISLRNETKQLHKVKEGATNSDLPSGLASFVWTEHLETFASLGMVTTEDVNCITFDLLLEKYRIDNIDFLQIDTEGYDYEIIKMIDFDRFTPGIIHYEHRHLSSRDDRACQQLLQRNGYRLLPKQYDTAAYRSL